MTPEVRLAQFAHAPNVQSHIDLMRLCLFDWIACGKSGVHDDVADTLRILTLANGGTPQSTLFGGGTAPAAPAALVNATTSHALDYDDTHFGHIGHTSVVVFSSLCAVAEIAGASYDALLEAAQIASECAVRVGLYLGRDHYQGGFHQTATAGAFGATLGVARLLGLSQDQTTQALGHCASQASGLKVQFGTMAKPLNAGLAASAAVQCALWARAGLTATDQGMRAFATTHLGAQDDHAIARLGKDWQIETISHKYHACCHGLHAMLDAIHDVEIPPAEIKRFDIATHPRWLTVCNIADPQTGLEAKFSYRFTAAMALSGINTADIATFSDETADREDLKKLAALGSVVGNETLSETQTRIVVHTADGQFSHEHDIGTPQPLQTRQTRLKHKVAAMLGEGAMNALWADVQGDDLAVVIRNL